jgi:hypothetical protein
MTQYGLLKCAPQQFGAAGCPFGDPARSSSRTQNAATVGAATGSDRGDEHHLVACA